MEPVRSNRGATASAAARPAMRRLTVWLAGALAALCAAGAAPPAAAVGPAGDCPDHGVLLDAAALCDTVRAPARQAADTVPVGDGRVRLRAWLLTFLRAGAPPADAPADGHRPLTVQFESGSPAPRAALWQRDPCDAECR